MPAGLLCSRFKMYRVSCGGCSISAAADGSGMSGYLVVYMGWTTTARRDESAIAGQNKKRPRKRKLMSDIFVKLVAISGHNKAAAAVATRFSRIHVHSTIFALAYDTHGREEASNAALHFLVPQFVVGQSTCRCSRRQKH